MNMQKIHEIRIPQLGVNDEFATLVEWLAEDKSWVKKGDSLCVIETSKALTEITAEETGYLHRMAEHGKEFKIKEVIGLISNSLEVVLPTVEHKVKVFMNHKLSSEAVKATPKARELAASANINLFEIKAKGIIREKDVKDYLNCWKKDKKESIAIYGAGLGGVTIKEAIELLGYYKVACFIDDNPELSSELQGIPIFKGDQLEKLKDKKITKIAIGIAKAKIKLRIRDKMIKLGMDVLNVIHPGAYVAPSVQMGVGNYIKAGAIIETNSIIGDCCIIDNGVIIAHDNIIGDGCHLAPGVSLGSSIEIGEQTIIGIGASISTKVKIGSRVIVGVGSSVTRDIPDNVIVEGVPGKVIGDRR